MKHSTQFVGLILAFLMITFSAQAAESAKMAVVDFQKALNSVEEGKAFVAELQKEAAKKEKELGQREQEIQKLQAELEDLQAKAASGLLKPEAMDSARKKQTEYQTKLEAFFQMRQQSGQEFAAKEQERRIQMLQRMREIVEEFGRKEGFSLVLERNESGLIYANQLTDLTERLIQSYNKKYKK